jgi:glycosyltransferase involved in cell wall biosynthesis
MPKRIGTEIRSYRNSIGYSGVPRVIRETHRYLDPALAKEGLDLVPVVTSDRSETAEREPYPYITSDSVLGKPEVGPEDVDCLLLLQTSTAIDFSRIAAIRRRRNLPLIAVLYDLLPIGHADWFYPWAGQSYKVLVQQILHVADHLIVPSKQVADDLENLNWRIKPSVHVFHLGTSFTQRPPRTGVGETIDLLYVSTLAPRKGHERLLDAFDELCQRGIDVRLTLVGKVGWNIDSLLSRLRTHPMLSRSLFWESDADDSRVASLLDRCSVAVVPAEAEGFGLFVEEALCAGTMVVASDIPVFRERPHKNLLFFDNSKTGLVEAILEAARRQPAHIEPGELRTMADFAFDVRDLVLKVIDEHR